jgi:hypothetical protein
MFADVIVPVSQVIIAEIEYCLHLIADHAGRQDLGGVINDGMLAQRAVLVFIDEQPRSRR